MHCATNLHPCTKCASLVPNTELAGEKQGDLWCGKCLDDAASQFAEENTGVVSGDSGTSTVSPTVREGVSQEELGYCHRCDKHVPSRMLSGLNGKGVCYDCQNERASPISDSPIQPITPEHKVRKAYGTPDHRMDVDDTTGSDVPIPHGTRSKRARSSPASSKSKDAPLSATTRLLASFESKFADLGRQVASVETGVVRSLEASLSKKTEEEVSQQMKPIRKQQETIASEIMRLSEMLEKQSERIRALENADCASAAAPSTKSAGRSSSADRMRGGSLFRARDETVVRLSGKEYSDITDVGNAVFDKCASLRCPIPKDNIRTRGAGVQNNFRVRFHGTCSEYESPGQMATAFQRAFWDERAKKFSSLTVSRENEGPTTYACYRDRSSYEELTQRATRHAAVTLMSQIAASEQTQITYSQRSGKIFYKKYHILCALNVCKHSNTIHFDWKQKTTAESIGVSLGQVEHATREQFSGWL